MDTFLGQEAERLFSPETHDCVWKRIIPSDLKCSLLAATDSIMIIAQVMLLLLKVTLRPDLHATYMQVSILIYTAYMSIIVAS